MRKVVLCLFYALCTFAIAFSLFWMARLARQTDIYVNLLPENDALRVKQGMTVTGDAALQEVLEDLGG